VVQETDIDTKLTKRKKQSRNVPSPRLFTTPDKSQDLPPSSARTNQIGVPMGPPVQPHKRPIEVWSLIVSILGVVAVVAYTTLTYLQLSAMRDSLALNRKSIEVRERPWVTVTDMQLLDLQRAKAQFRPQTDLLLVFSLQNSGLVPAFDIRIKGNWIRTNQPFPEYPPYPEQTFPSQPSQPVLGAGNHLAFPLLLQRQTDAEYANIVNGRTTLYAFGILTYRDPAGAAHQSRFCVFYLPATGTWSFAERYNTAD
jgi:hypothetical protein